MAQQPPASHVFRYPFHRFDLETGEYKLTFHPAWVALLIFLFALLFRLPATGYGLPYIHYWDEPAYLKLSLQMMKTGDFDHQWYNIPPFFLYQQTLAQTALFLNSSKTHPYELEEFSIDVHNREVSNPAIPLWSRQWTALLGAVSCALLFLIFRNYIPEAYALVAALLLALFPGHIEQSVLVTADMPLQLMVLLTFAATIQLNNTKQFWSYCACGILVGLCAATKYNGAIAAVIPIAYMFSKRTSEVASWLAVFFGMIAGFTLGFPYWWVKFPEFISAFAWEMYHYNTLFEMAGVSNYFGLSYLSELFVFGLGPISLACLFIGIFRFPYAESKLSFLQLNAFPLVYGIWLLSQSSNFIRNLTPLYPWFALYAACGLSQAWGFLNKPNIVKTFYLNTAPMLLVIIISQASLFTLSLKYSTETRSKLVEWIVTEIPAERVVAIPADLHILSTELQKLPQTIVELQTSNIHQQTLSGIDHVVLGKSPTYAMPDAPIRLTSEEQAEVLALQDFIDQLPLMHDITFKRTYSRFSSLGKFHEGKWLLGSYSINPSILVTEQRQHEAQWLPLTQEMLQVDEYFWQPPSLNQTLQGNAIQLKTIDYPYGMGIHGGSKISITVPEGAKRFVVDIGISNDMATEVSPQANFELRYQDQAFQLEQITRQSPIYRIDIAVEAQSEITISTLEPDEDYNADHFTLGFCVFSQ